MNNNNIAKILPEELKNVWNPLDRVAEDEDEDDGETDLGQQHLVLLRGRRRERGRLRGGHGGATAHRYVFHPRQPFEGEQVEDDEKDKRPQTHEDEIHPDAINLETSKWRHTFEAFVYKMHPTYKQSIGKISHKCINFELLKNNQVIQ